MYNFSNELIMIPKLSVSDCVKMMEVLGQLVNQRKIDDFGAEKGFIFNEHEQINISAIILDLTNYIIKETELFVKPQKEPYTIGYPPLKIKMMPEDIIKDFGENNMYAARPEGNYPPEVTHIPPPSPYIYGVLCDKMYNRDIEIWNETKNETGAKYIPIQSLEGFERNYFKRIIEHPSWNDVTSNFEKKKFESENNIYFKIPVSDWTPMINPPFNDFKKETKNKHDQLDGRLWAIGEIRRRIEAQTRHGKVKTYDGLYNCIFNETDLMILELKYLQREGQK